MMEAVATILALLAAGYMLGALNARVGRLAEASLTPLVLLLVFTVGVVSSKADIIEGGRAALVIAGSTMAASLVAGVAVWRLYGRLQRRRRRSR